MNPKEEVGAGEKIKLADAYRAAFAIWSSPIDSKRNDGSQADQDKGSVLTADIMPDSSNYLQLAPHTDRSLILDEANDIKSPDNVDKPWLPLSVQNLTLSIAKVQEEEQQRIFSKSDESYLLSSWDLQDIAFEERMRAWVDTANPEQRTTEMAKEDFQGGDTHFKELETRSVVKLSSKESQATDNESTDSYLVERSLRVKRAEERISALVSKGGSRCIKPGVTLLLRHATHMDAEELINLYNSYVRGTFQCLDTKPIAVDDMRQCIDESRKEELPFIVAIDVERSQNSGRKMLGGQNVGRCLMDAMMTLADPQYSPKGGYYYMPSPHESNVLTVSSSISCRPLSHLAMLMSHADSEVSRFRRIRDWLSREHKFSQKGDLPSVAEKMGQLANIAILIRRICA
ncbi:hypothetical protein UA08_08630 [Talaromyces atroroseus]|uniref:Uncharacterized protein n=1 Tax=Talaromyces atroroseus TaxID=1441469 RepID=A0A225A6F3_TALAT|nr:hypothetical protein UA08_08630 [Talaromyces atroroseus]OKL55962.1 hypothetical protein UA08_08630 [Talaromyces atroroseus]